MKDNQVLIKFGKDIKSSVQGVVMLSMERYLRAIGIEAEVLKETMADDSRLRSKMTVEERAKL